MHWACFRLLHHEWQAVLTLHLATQPNSVQARPLRPSSWAAAGRAACCHHLASPPRLGRRGRRAHLSAVPPQIRCSGGQGRTVPSACVACRHGQSHMCARPAWILVHSHTCCTPASCSPTAAQRDFRPAMPAHLPPGLASKAVSSRLCMSRRCSFGEGLNCLAGHAVWIMMPGVGIWPARCEEGHIHLLSMCCCSASPCAGD